MVRVKVNDPEENHFYDYKFAFIIVYLRFWQILLFKTRSKIYKQLNAKRHKLQTYKYLLGFKLWNSLLLVISGVGVKFLKLRIMQRVTTRDTKKQNASYSIFSVL